MKSKFWIIPLVLLLVQGCDGMLTENPEDTLTPDNFYETPRDANAAVFGIYESLSVPKTALDAISDASRIGPLEPNPSYRILGRMEWTPTTGSIDDWGSFYETITRANLAISRLPGVEMDASQRAALMGEAKFLRALSYFYLVRLYGGVPIITSASDRGLNATRAPVDSVYQQIVIDAEEAASALPAEQNSPGRATRGAALTLLAKAHLTRKEWNKSADYAKQVIDSGNYGLFENYLHAFLPQYENGVEHIFSLQANPPEVTTWYAAIYYPRQVGRGQGGGFGQVQPTSWHYDSYAPNGYRKEVTYKMHWESFGGEQFDLYPHVFKYRPTDIRDIGNGDVNDLVFRYAEVLLIYAEALNELGRPEEAVQYVNQIRRRARNGDGEAPRAEPADYEGPFGQDTVRAVIFQERRWELAHEYKRWFDLVRRGEDYFMEQIEAHDPQPTGLEPTDMLWPIPQPEIDVTDLQQNPGY